MQNPALEVYGTYGAGPETQQALGLFEGKHHFFWRKQPNDGHGRRAPFDAVIGDGVLP
jgi:hypothetical protein